VVACPVNCNSLIWVRWRVKYSEIVADNLSKAGWSWGCVATVDSNGQTIWIVDAHRDDGKRFVVRADEKTMPVTLAACGPSLFFFSFLFRFFLCFLF
jgi:hypothetical protein